MYLDRPVYIPKVSGITFRKKGQNTYVQYETGRRYDPNRKFNLVDRKEIGVQIPGRAEMMLPNGNYLELFGKEENEMDDREKTEMEDYEKEREHGFMLRDFFEQLFYEFQMMSRSRAGETVNENKVKRLNRVLAPLMEMMKGEEYAEFLELIPEPNGSGDGNGRDGSLVPGRNGENRPLVPEKGMTYSDVALLMTQFKGAVNRYFMKRR